MKKLFLFLALISLSPSFAQHCPYCGRFIQVLKPVAPGDSMAISGLKITITDSLGAPIQSEAWRDGRWQDKPLMMWQNPSFTTFKGLIDNNNPLEAEKVRFWFAEDNYVIDRLLMGSYWIVIEDVDGPQNGGEFKTLKIPIEEIQSFPLCTYNSTWDSPYSNRYFVKDYAPLVVELETKKS